MWRHVKSIGLVLQMVFALTFAAATWLACIALMYWVDGLIGAQSGPLQWLPHASIGVIGMLFGVALFGAFSGVGLVEVSERMRYPKPVRVRLFLVSPTPSRFE